MHGQHDVRRGDLQILDRVFGEAVALARVEYAEAAAQAIEDCGDDVVADRLVEEESFAQTIFRHVTDALGDGIGRRLEMLRRVVDQEFALVGRADAGERQREFVAPGIEQAGEAENLAAPQLERDVLECAAGAETLGLEDYFAGGCAGTVAAAIELLAGHQLHELGLAVIDDWPLGDLFAVAQDDYLAADGVALVQLVADEEDGDARGAQAIDDADQVVDFALGERCCRFVHDHHARLGRDGAGDGNELARGDRQQFDRRALEIGVVRQADGFQRVRRSLFQDGTVVLLEQTAARGDELFGQGDVLGDRQIGDQREILINGFDAGRQRL